MKKLVTLFVTTTLAATPVLAQGGSAKGISEASLRGHMEFLASDALNGRGSGTRDEWIAATYIASHLRRWGIEPLGDGGDYVQDVKIERSEAAAPPTLSFGSTHLTHGKEIFVQALSAATITGPLQKLKADGPANPGAVVLLPEGAPATVRIVGQAQGQPPATAPAIIVTLEDEQQRTRRQATPSRPLTLPARIVGLPAGSAPMRPTTIVVNKDAYAAIAALPEETTLTVRAEMKLLI